MPTAPSYKSEQVVRTDMHSDNSGYFQILAQIKFFKCLSCETWTKSYVIHVESIINIY